MPRPNCFVPHVILILGLALATNGVDADDSRVRFATFNASLNRPAAGRLIQDLCLPNNRQAQQIAEIIQHVRPDVLLINEFDYDERGLAADGFAANYLAIAQNKQSPIEYKFRYLAPVNTGVPSGLDLDQDGSTAGPGDAFGYGEFPGQYGMLVLSRFPIEVALVRTFQTFLWRDMPNSLLPGSYYGEDQRAILRLSSKSHWDLPLKIGDQTVHFLCAHPTPPVFDGSEDRNGRRNHDEIRFWADYIDASRSIYIYDDAQRRGGLSADARFVIAGDMNADPLDGDSTADAINQLLRHPLVDSVTIPASKGATEKNTFDAGVNTRHRGNPSHDTTDFTDRSVGNLRLDYVLPSKSLRTVKVGVFWPATQSPGHELVEASDHRLTWIDIEL
ncbi:MAG: endonuclease/exonuclease/phosphatase family protein [Planctomycetaceae bacterium]|nr:endonuclease/exonuclease/phosphatase family protein [Planctomycetales bacterium]MCB9927642.1 endonuclease/exonuclease/phosphatase family protein [Planctomycetaceae bacterium]